MQARAMPISERRRVRAGVLDIAFEQAGSPEGAAAVLLHGFPYDPRAFDKWCRICAGPGFRVVVPYLRGFGPTRFVADDVPRSGQQAALGVDLLALLDALAIERAVLAGYDWGGRAACIVAALWPERVRGLVTGCGYNIQDIAGSVIPGAPELEHRYWYRYLPAWRTRPCRAGGEPASLRPAALAAVVAKLDIRGGDVRAQRRILR